MDLNSLITRQQNLPEYTLSNREMAEIEDFHPNCDLTISLENWEFSIDFIGLRHKSSLICYFSETIGILEKIGSNILKRLVNFNLFLTH